MRRLWAVFLLAIAIAGCGDEGNGGSVDAGAEVAAENRPPKPVSEYEEVLFDLRDAAAAGEIYDAYGFAEYMPASQRAAIDGFCFVVERMLKDGEADRFGETGYVAREVIAQAEEEFDYGDPAPIEAGDMAVARKAIRKLRSIVDFEGIDEELASSYVTACYNRR